MSELLTEKLAIVTGATRGIGAAIALHLAQEGATVIGTATSNEGAERITQVFAKHKLKGEGFILDVADQASVDAFYNQLKEKYASPDILVNNAGITRDNLLLRMKDEEWDEVLNTNLTGVYRMTKLPLRDMIKKRWGRIIILSSVSGLAGLPGQGNYSAAKAGVIGFAKAIAKEIASRGVTVNVVAPGFIRSDMTSSLPAEYQEKILSEIPMARQGEPEEIAAAVVFLASPKASYITGNVLNVNGGLYT